LVNNKEICKDVKGGVETKARRDKSLKGAKKIKNYFFNYNNTLYFCIFNYLIKGVAMKVEVELIHDMRLAGRDEEGHLTYFDTVAEDGGGTAPSPMSTMLQALGACSFMDVISILRKKHKKISSMKIEIEAERADTHPKVFTKAHLKYILTSPDTTKDDLESAISLSAEKYCSVSVMFKRAGCNITWESVINPY